MRKQKNLKSIDIKLLDEIFEMGGGYVLDFSNRTFSEFFNEELGINIDDPCFDVDGTSKAKRLRFYLRQANTTDVIKVLLALWEYREALRRRSGKDETMAEAKAEFFLLINKLGGKPPEDIRQQSTPRGFENLSDEIAMNLLNKLMAVSALAPHPRGFAFESFLKELFDANGMDGRSSFRVVGEQIDGSFDMSGETYLLEAKWTSKPVDASDLRSFNAKVEDKASWARGLFVSDCGFSEEGLIAFGKGKSLVCMDGLDICEMLQKKLSLKEVLSKKVRRAAETGKPFVRLRELV
ncbi:restriction endonuclease [Pseudoalteromonas sp. NZS11]|uniref:restriction endonuclease n=1 Tax=Pseudoalteromonas sp. NZS11 TaxID=2792049 RepID=UPI0018CF576E|nr:restriction endonuclease [Pseudoalteromonas sp. NZS11]MBH0079614.1 restriction endonuclease [Pseudoalteromonas sp. NZS11]